MGDKDTTIKLFKNIGFKTVYAWYTTIAYPCNDYKQLVKLYLNSPFMALMRSKCTNEKEIEEIEQLLINGIKNIVNSNLEKNVPLTHDMMCIVAIKHD